MEIGGRPNGISQDEGDNVDEQNYGVLEEDGLDVRSVDNTPPHLRAVVDAIEYKGVDALRRALGSSSEYVESSLLRKLNLVDFKFQHVLNSKNIDINEAVKDTALHWACFHAELSCVQLPLERGARLEVKDGSFLHNACLGGNKEVVQHPFSAARSPHIIKRMLETVESELGDTPLHHAARADHSEVIRVMLAAGSDPNRRNAYRKTPVDRGSEARRICDEFNRNIPHR